MGWYVIHTKPHQQARADDLPWNFHPAESRALAEVEALPEIGPDVRAFPGHIDVRGRSSGLGVDVASLRKVV